MLIYTESEVRSLKFGYLSRGLAMPQSETAMSKAKPTDDKRPSAVQELAQAHRTAQQHMNQGKYSVSDFREIASAYGRYVSEVKGDKPSGR